MKYRVEVDIPDGGVRVFELGGVEIAVFRRGEAYHALGNRCPHVRGPLHLGAVENGEVICPWHGARFSLDCGKPSRGPTETSVPVFAVERLGDELEIEIHENRREDVT